MGNKFKVGDKVVVVDSGLTYSNYDDAFNFYNVVGFRSNFNMGKGTRATVVKKAVHPSNGEEMVFIKNAQGTVLIGVDGLEHAKEQDLVSQIKVWSKEKNLDKADPFKQFTKLQEEIGELADGLLRNNPDTIIDSLGDIQVVLIILHQQLGFEMDETLQVAYDQIKNRTGKTIDGVFIKDEDL